MRINNWWDNDRAEIYWMEIRHEAEGLGQFLRAPKAAGNGTASWSYDLTSYVQSGDRVFHWHKTAAGEPGIVGWSEAIGPIETISWSWQARGSRGRKRGAPTSGPAWNLLLADYTELASPVTRSDLNARRAEVLAVQETVVATHGKPTYAPFQNYGQREIRAQQGYLTKFPAALVGLLFGPPDVGPTDPSLTFGTRTGRA